MNYGIDRRILCCTTPVQKSVILCLRRTVKWLHCVMFVLVTSLCLAFSDADIEFDFDFAFNNQCIQSMFEGRL